jgi:hypothetical protein
MLLKMLAKEGVPEPLATVIVIVKMNRTIEISTSVGKANVTFPSTFEVKRGDNLAPVLFRFVRAAVDSMGETPHFYKAVSSKN